MRKIGLFFLLLCGVLLFARYGVKRSSDIIHRIFEKKVANTLEANPSEPVIAVFSFRDPTLNRIIKSFRHYTIKLNNTASWEVEKAEFDHLADSIPLLITIGTWANSQPPYDNCNPLEDVAKGKYDRVIKQLCTKLVGNRQNIYFRFDPEMEVPINRYPWQQKSAYIDAFRHFTNLCRNYAPQVKLVWGPAGYPGAMEWYPGDEFVDAASVVLKSDSENSLTVYPSDYTVAYDLFRRLHRLRFIKKPIFVLSSNQVPGDSVDEQLVLSLTRLIDQEKAVIYSNQNFLRPKLDAFPVQHREIGVYDPQSLLNEEKPVTVEHLFVDFGSLKDGSFEKDFRKVVARNHNVIVTFEPFRNPGGKDDLQVLQHISEGQYDQEINQLYSIILSAGRRVYLRYAHEMEIPITRYPWQSQNPVAYIKSFRYFMSFKHPLPATIKRIWGPAGDRGSLEWWPGNDVVDFVSVAIYGLPDKNITDPEKQETFSTIFKRKVWRVRFVDKPLFITEFGVKGPEDYQTRWMEDAAKVIRENSRIVGVNYFNMSDTPKAWGDIKPPDWSISKKTFYRFIDVLQER